ncbi:MAG TPA: hypothetical protein VGH28_25200 [Polyangiaceae bacterium]|jgi:hypothetical protein
MNHDDDFAPPSEEEIRESERLREALEDPAKESADADLLRAVQSAAKPKAIAKEALDQAVDRAVASSRRGVVVRVAFGASLLVAAAAVILLFVWRGRPQPEAPSLARARSTQQLFQGHFDLEGGESARIDRIVVARADDLRENHFARWGVR